MNTLHAQTRSQQRGIPPMLDLWLDLYGAEEYDGHGAVIVYLNKKSIRDLAHDLGRRPVLRMADWFGVYKVKSTDGRTITVGHRTNRIWRKS